MPHNHHQLNEYLIRTVNKMHFNKPLAVMSVAIKKTATSVSTGLLSTKTTCSEPALSDTCMVESDPPVDSNKTTAIDNSVVLVQQFILLFYLGFSTSFNLVLVQF